MKQYLLNNPKTLLFCSGCLSALAMAPVYAWPLMMLGYSVLLHFLLKAKNWKVTAKYTFSFFFGYFLTGLYWISSSLFVDLGTWWWALPFSFVGLPLLLTLFPTFILSIMGLVNSFRLVLFITGLIIADVARGYLFTGFPWNMPSHTWIHTDIMMVTLPYIGFYGLNALSIVLFCLPILLKNKFKLIYIIIFVGLSFIPLPNSNAAQIGDHNIVMVQANIPQHEKWDPDLVWRNFDRHVDMSKSAIKTNKPQIIIWPETAISQNFLKHENPKKEFQRFLKSLPNESLLITGYLHYKNNQPYNSLAVFNHKAEIIALYDKHHLVPFGEYMPFGLSTITGFSNFSSGAKPQLIRLDNYNLEILPLICYESIFPRYSSHTTESSIILNITNDAWFGDTAGPYQHFDHMVFRSIENKSPALRLSGNGLSAMIDSRGQIKKLSFLNKSTAITNNHK